MTRENWSHSIKTSRVSENTIKLSPFRKIQSKEYKLLGYRIPSHLEETPSLPSSWSQITAPKSQMGVVSPTRLKMSGSEAVAGAESAGELLLRAAAMVPAERYALAAAAVVSVLVLLPAPSARGALRDMPSGAGHRPPAAGPRPVHGHRVEAPPRRSSPLANENWRAPPDGARGWPSVLRPLAIVNHSRLRVWLCRVGAVDGVASACWPGAQTGEHDGHPAALELGSSRRRSPDAHWPNSSAMVTFDSIARARSFLDLL